MNAVIDAPTERKYLPSASGMERLALCAGSWQAEQSIPYIDTASEEAASGTRIHAVMAGESPDKPLTEDEEKMVSQLQRLEAELTESTYGSLDNAHTVIREKRLWFHDDNKTPILSGKPDLVAVYGLRALIVDYKTGRGEVTAAHSNLQLRALVAIVSDNVRIREATVAIIQPMSEGGISTASYNEDDIAMARDEVEQCIKAAQADNAKRTPSALACKYCRAKAHCPEAREVALETPIPVVDFITANELAAALTNEKLAAFLDRAAFAEKVIEACKDEAKRRIEAGQSLDGWMLKEGTARETVTDPQRVFDRFFEAGGEVGQFMSCVSIAKGKLKTALKDVTAKRGKELDAAFDTLLAGCVETKMSAPSLVKQ